MIQPSNPFKGLREYIDRNGTDDNYEPRPCTQATGAPPGSPDKIEVLRQRVTNNEHLWHPNDATTYALVRQRLPKVPDRYRYVPKKSRN